MNEGHKSLKGYYCLHDDKPQERVIRQYMRLDYLIRLLETQMYYVKKRKMFNDANEGYYKEYLEFEFTAIGENVPPQHKHVERKMTFKEIVECPASCWNISEYESYLMWKCYASEVGACIETTVTKLISSFNVDFSEDSSNWIICSPMKYVKTSHSSTEEGQLFNKYYGYSDEHEFRFYFRLKSDFVEEGNSILVPVNTKNMINKIIISPFICREAANKIAQLINNSYGFENIKQSKINLQ